MKPFRKHVAIAVDGGGITGTRKRGEHGSTEVPCFRVFRDSVIQTLGNSSWPNSHLATFNR